MLNDDYTLARWARQYWTPGTGPTTAFSDSGIDSENVRFYDRDPWGRQAVVWEARPSGTSDSGCGGFTSSSITNVDPTYMYRSSMWYNRTVYGDDSLWTDTTRGRLYFGLYCYTSGGTKIGIVQSDNAGNTNFYHHYTTSTAYFSIGNWELCVGHIYPAGTALTSRTMHPESGIWRTNGSERINIRYDGAFLATAAKVQMRAWLYYCNTDTTPRQRYLYPRFDKCDGTEPTLQQLLRHGAHRVLSTNLGKIRIT